MPVVDAWLAMVQGDIAPVTDILNKNNPALSPVAAFALGQIGMELGGQALLDAFRPNAADAGGGPRSEEVLWAIAEVFGNQDAYWMRTKVIQWWLEQSSAPDKRMCFLIQKSGHAPEGSREREYLDACLKQPEPFAQSHAIRAFGKLSEPGIRDWLIPLCGLILQENWKELLKSPKIGLREAPKGRHVAHMQQAALEVLRDIGDEGSLNDVRDFRLRTGPELSHVGFDVAEQIYWRLTGGLSNETFATTAGPRSEGESRR